MGYANNVGRGVLAVGICGHYTDAVWEGADGSIDTGFKRRALRHAA